ncbi:MAG: aldehyde dehydrogenase family protein, partial [Gammaproteobacteria bacterium]|nr:aldehyde dehydrogenase family protein [Gammaproteobacteria bacterium]
MNVCNPADGSLIREIAEDSAAAVAAKYARARASQPAWAATPLAQRLEKLALFRDAVQRQRERLARTLTQETGKPIRQARAELESFDGRLKFFLENTEGVLEAETVLEETNLKEQITHEPLGVIANISAWNYPWFVGGNVI